MLLHYICFITKIFTFFQNEIRCNAFYFSIVFRSLITSLYALQ